jgi:hypothetical protein
MSACSAVKGNLLKFPKLIKLLTVRLVSTAKLHGYAVKENRTTKPLTERIKK